jgi:hypothetical protein
LGKASINFTGRLITDTEVELIQTAFGSNPASSELIELLKKFEIIGQYISLSKDVDLSNLGVEMEWMCPKKQVEEAFAFYPGIPALKMGYLPIGSCLGGSGDPYFLRLSGEIWMVYRIPHDSVILSENAIDANQVESVCSLEYLLKSVK